MVDSINITPPDIALVSGMNRGGYIMEPLDNEIVSQLTRHKAPQLKELGLHLGGNGNWGSGAEYQGRLARAQEAVGIATVHDRQAREKFVWGPGEGVDLSELDSTIQIGEELQIIDYKDRIYCLVKAGFGYSVIGAYSGDTPLGDRYGAKLEYQGVHITKFETATDRKMRPFIGESNHISLVEVGTQLRPSRLGGEEYTVTREGRAITASASRLQMTFDGGDAYGVLASQITLVPGDPRERERIEAAQWRIQDSIREISLQLQKSHSSYGGAPFETISLGQHCLSVVRIDEEGDNIVLRLEDTVEGILVEYSVGISGSSEKKYVQAGGNWILPWEQDQELDGSRKIHTLQAARVLDEIRYSVQEQMDNSE